MLDEAPDLSANGRNFHRKKEAQKNLHLYNEISI